MNIQFVLTSKLRPPAHQLRESSGDLEELKASIKAVGLLEPIVVRERGNGFEIIGGWRRWVAAHEIGLAEVPCNVIEADNKTAFLLALQENIQRKNMDIIEEARAFYRFSNDYGYGSITELASLISKSPTYVVERVKLLKLPEKTLEFVAEKKLSASHAEELTVVKDTAQADELAQLAVEKGLTRDQLHKATLFVGAGYSPGQAVKSVIAYPTLGAPIGGQRFDPIKAAREQVQVALSYCLATVSENIETMPEGAERGRWLNIRYELHQLVDRVMKLNRELKKGD